MLSIYIFQIRRVPRVRRYCGHLQAKPFRQPPIYTHIYIYMHIIFMTNIVIVTVMVIVFY